MEVLLETDGCLLIEDNPLDIFWGGVMPGSKNMLGKILMEARDEALKKNEAFNDIWVI